MKHPLLPSILTISLSLALAGCNNESIQNSPNVDGKGAQLEPGGYMYFFEQDVPQAITTTSTQSLAVTNRHYKDGAQSLRWQFDPTTILTFHQTIGYSPEKEDAITPQTFTAWIYNEKPIDDSLLFEFGTDDSTQAKFHYRLNFKGWRGIAVPYRDMQGQANANMNRLRIIAPQASGTIYFDQMMMSVPVDNRWPTADYQQPFVNPTVVDMASKNWTALMMYDEMLKEHHATFDFTVPFDDTSGDTANLYQQFD
ncbi:chondroitinase family protein [Photobacterium damselae subsp. piscicida]|nr:chondroitinase family protein [Photobacterium damselae subsp. piscicida]